MCAVARRPHNSRLRGREIDDGNETADLKPQQPSEARLGREPLPAARDRSRRPVEECRVDGVTPELPARGGVESSVRVATAHVAESNHAPIVYTYTAALSGDQTRRGSGHIG